MNIIVFFLVLLILMLVHELGHFIAAKKAGVWVEEFGFGIPPRLYGKKIGDTVYSINMIPFGAFVRLHGEAEGEKVKKSKKAFVNKKPWQKIIIIIAGVIMNFILAIVCFAVVYSYTGVPRESENVTVISVFKDSPAEKAGILPGDVVFTLDGENIKTTDVFIRIIDDKKDTEVNLTLLREDNEYVNTTLTPRGEPPAGEGPMGVAITSTEIYFPPLWQRPFLGVYHGFKEALFWGSAIVLGLLEMFRKLFVGQVPSDIAGPVGIYALTSKAASVGILTLVNFVGIFSVNLAILNIIPFPGLDGGRLMFIGAETVLGKKILPKTEGYIHALGLIILIMLLFAITVHDVRRVLDAGSISGFLDSILR